MADHPRECPVNACSIARRRQSGLPTGASPRDGVIVKFRRLRITGSRNRQDARRTSLRPLSLELVRLTPLEGVGLLLTGLVPAGLGFKSLDCFLELAGENLLALDEHHGCEEEAFAFRSAVV